MSAVIVSTSRSSQSVYIPQIMHVTTIQIIAALVPHQVIFVVPQLGVLLWHS